jgi:hypothetical protein
MSLPWLMVRITVGLQSQSCTSLRNAGANIRLVPHRHEVRDSQNGSGESLANSVESAKWCLWHGEADEALQKLSLLRDHITDTKKRSKFKGLQDYLKNNQKYLVNYSEREKANKVFTSQVAESHIDSMINTRHKRKQKMQWTRKGAHNVLQIRAMMASNEWKKNG